MSHLRLQFSHLNKHKFRHGFNDTVIPMCSCGTEVETNEHFLLCCHCSSSQGFELFDNLYNLDPSFSKLNNKEKVTYLLYGSTSNPNTLNHVIINLVIVLTHFVIPPNFVIPDALCNPPATLCNP